MAAFQLHDACDVWEPEIPLDRLADSYLWVPQLRSAITLIGAMHKNKDGEKALFREYLQTPPFRGAIFTGSTGNGRHTTAEALACSLDKNNEMLQVRVYGADLDYESADEALSAMASVARAARNSRGLILLLDEPQDCRHSRMLQTKLLRLMEKKDIHMYLIIVTDRPEHVQPGLRRKLMLCHCAKPTEDQRREWLARQLREPYRVLPEEMSATEAARETEGFSWHQLQMLAVYLRQRLFWNAKQRTEEIGKKDAQQFISEEDKTRAMARAGAIGKRKALMKNGSVCPTEEEYQEVLQAIREQELPDQPMPAIMPISVIPGQQMYVQNAAGQVPMGESPSREASPGTVESVVEEVMGAGKEKLSEEELLKKRAQHENPEEMDYNTLTGTLGLKLPSAEALDQADAEE